MSDQIILDTINIMIKNVKPISFNQFNTVIQEIEPDRLIEVEKNNPAIGVRLVDYNDPEKGWAISTASIIATITDLLVGKRLAFEVDESGYIIGVVWFSEKSKE